MPRVRDECRGGDGCGYKELIGGSLVPMVESSVLIVVMVMYAVLHVIKLRDAKRVPVLLVKRASALWILQMAVSWLCVGC